jgi:type IX secretion system substrate protein
MKASHFLLALFSITSSIVFAQPIVTYPLRAGDRWEYVSSVNSSVSAVLDLGDTLMPGGITYANLSGGVFAYPSYQRQSGNRVYWLSPYSAQEVPRYNFSLSTGDTVSSIPFALDTLDITLISHDAVFILGRNRPQWRFHFHFRHIVDGDEVHVITDSIGLTFVQQVFAGFAIRGAIANGVTYGTLTAVRDPSYPVPNRIELIQNYPNPFNPATRISFSLPQSQSVDLRVYDVRGRLVATLLDNQEQSAGNHSIVFDANRLAGGTYICRLRAGSRQVGRTMLLLR